MIYTIAAVMLRFIGLFCLGDVCHNDRRFLTTGGVQEGSAACRPSGLYLRVSDEGASINEGPLNKNGIVGS